MALLCIYLHCNLKLIPRHNSQLCSAAHWKAYFSVCNTAKLLWLWIELYYVVIFGQFFFLLSVSFFWKKTKKKNIICCVWGLIKHFKAKFHQFFTSFDKHYPLAKMLRYHDLWTMITMTTDGQTDHFTLAHVRRVKIAVKATQNCLKLTWVWNLK